MNDHLLLNNELRNVELISSRLNNLSAFGKLMAKVFDIFGINNTARVVPGDPPRNEYNENVLSQHNSLKNASDKFDLMTFIRCLFHDLRGPLNNISLGIDILFCQVKSNEENAELFKSVKESCEYLSESLDSFLNIQQRNNLNVNDTIKLDYQPFNIVGLIKKQQYIVLSNIINKKLQIKYDIKPVNEWVIGDYKHIQHVLNNLIVNAIKFSSENATIIIRLESMNNIKHRHEYLISIEDENIFIPKNIKKHLFEKHNTGNNETGSGLGLYICKNIVELHGGKLEHVYKKNRAKGNIFNIFLPLDICISSDKSKTEVKSIKSGWHVENITDEKLDMMCYHDVSNNNIARMNSIDKKNDSGSGSDRSLRLRHSIFSKNKKVSTIKFMVIDDSETSRKMMVKLLTAQCKNIQIYDASDGLDALVKMIRIGEAMETINIMLVDNVMPNLTGEFLSKIIRCIGFEGLIIGVTGNGLKEDINSFLENGADYVFVKPFTKAKLDKLLEFIKNNGYISYPNMKIKEDSGKLVWREFPHKNT